MSTETAADPSTWGPNLYAWLRGYWEANGTNANAWTDRNPGLQGATVSRWRTGTVPSLQAMRLVADALAMPLVDVLAIAGVLRDGETGHGKPSAPSAPSIDVAIDKDPTLTPLARRSLRDILAAFRAAEGGSAGVEVVVAESAPKPRRRARG